ncbi:hypothetical protein KCQ_10665 [Pectobacterium atrosepticum ICMP 1526]|nr:hypothetical protein KCQ_10665 [Pectobacterium atrosepticum ICMP 1526]
MKFKKASASASASALGTSQKSATESPSIIHSYSMVEKALIKKKHKAA